MKIFATCCLILVIAVVLFQFTGEEKTHSHQIKPLRPASFPSQSESDALTKAHNEFGFKLYRELQKESNGENVFISPTSIATAFGMLYNGTVDQVRSEFDEVFEFTKVPDESFNTANQ